MPEKLDPRILSILERDQQLEQRRKPKQPLSRERYQAAAEKQQQAIRNRCNNFSSKQKDRKLEENDQNLTDKMPQFAPPKPPKDNSSTDFDPQHLLVSTKPLRASTAGTTPQSVGAPGTNKGLPSLYQSAEQLKRRVSLILYQRCLYVYNGRSYDLLSSSDDVIRLYRAKVDDQLGGERTLACIKHLYPYLLADSDIVVEKVIQNQRIAVLRNGIYNVITGQLREHSPKEIAFSWVNAEYVDHSKCKHFRKFLQDVTGGDEILQERIWQALGYILTQSNEAKSFFVLGVAPNSGKSLLGNFIESLFEESYVSNVPLNAFNRPFELAPIAGKAVNISLDLPATRLNADAVSALKQLTGGDAILINAKYERPFRYRSRAKLLFATNFPLELASRDDAFWQRMVYLPFDYSIPKAQQNPGLFDMLQEERDAIVSEALRHTRTLIDNNYCFPTTPLIERRMEEWQGRANPSIENFLRDCCIIDESCRGELVDTLFPAYERYCDSVGFSVKSRPFFKQFLEDEVGLRHFKMRDGGNNPQSAFKSIKLIQGGSIL